MDLQGADEIGGEEPVQWIVESGSSQSDLHPGKNVLETDLDKPWLTQTPVDDAWLVLEPRPPTAFNRVEIVNAGSALVEIHGLRDDAAGNSDDDYELLLSPQQVMSVKDLIRKSNRNQAFLYDIDGNHKLASVAAQQRWRRIRVNCRQPLGTSEHRACIGLAYMNFTSCQCKSKAKANSLTQFQNSKNVKPAATITKRKLPSWASSSEPKTGESPEKQPRARLHQEKDLKAEGGNTANGMDLVDSEQGGSCKLEHVVESQYLQDKAVASKMECCAPGAESGDTGEEQARRKSHLKRRSPDAKEMGGKETKRAKLDKESSKAPAVSKRTSAQFPAEDEQSHQSKLSGTPQNKELDGDGQVEGRTDGHPDRMGDKLAQGESSQRKGRTSRGENQVLRDVCPGSKDEPGREFSKLLEGVVFTISGIQNPERGDLRSKGLEMGAQYRPDWTTDCTLLVCAFMDTPKFKQVQDLGGSIVSKDWILECHKKRKLVDFERFVLNRGRPWRLPDNTNKSPKQHKVNCGSVEEVRNWAQEDLILTMNWLQQQDAKPDLEELEVTAAQGILVCLEDAIKSLTENQGLSSIMENWAVLPRAVKEIAAIEKGGEGYSKTSKSILQETERLKGIYDESLKDVLASSRKSMNAIGQKMGGDEEEEVDDDATEGMPAIDSQETVDYNSDDTTIMDSETIAKCTKKLMSRFTRDK